MLVVDDDAATCAMLSDALRDDFNITCESDPRRVVDVVRTSDVHVVLLDLHLPGISGLELLTQLRAIDEDLAIMIVTGHPSFETAQASIPHHVEAYVRKPVDLVHLKANLQRVAREKGITLDDPERALAKIGETIRGLRNGKKLSLRQLSRRSGVSASLLSAVERSAASPSLTSLLRVSNALGVRLRDIFVDV